MWLEIIEYLYCSRETNRQDTAPNYPYSRKPSNCRYPRAQLCIPTLGSSGSCLPSNSTLTSQDWGHPYLALCPPGLGDFLSPAGAAASGWREAAGMLCCVWIAEEGIGNCRPEGLFLVGFLERLRDQLARACSQHKAHSISSKRHYIWSHPCLWLPLTATSRETSSAFHCWLFLGRGAQSITGLEERG